MEGFLSTLELQVNQVLPPSQAFITNKPNADLILQWANDMAAKAVSHVELDMGLASSGYMGMTKSTATLVQKALIVSLVTGCHMPPIRLDIIKNLQHPDHHMACTDACCNRGAACMGNHLQLVQRAVRSVPGPGWDPPGPQEGLPRPEAPGASAQAGLQQEEVEEGWLWGYSNTSIKVVVAHGKTERKRAGVDLTWELPRGDLTKLMLAHIMVGHSILTLESAELRPRLFHNSACNPFTHVSFAQFWNNLVKCCPIANSLGIQPFPPSACRTLFVDSYTSANGVPPSLWDGASLVMGNSTRQWQATYNPHGRSRLAQESVDKHKEYVSKRFKATIPLEEPMPLEQGQE